MDNNSEETNLISPEFHMIDHGIMADEGPAEVKAKHRSCSGCHDKDDLNVTGIKICNGVSRKMTVDHDTVIQPTKMALLSVPEEWHWSQ